MRRDFAKQVSDELKAKNGPQLSLYEAMQMQAVITDGYEVYACQKGDVTFLAWKSKNRVIVKTVTW